MKKYTLELTEEQYNLIALCTEVVHRISVGQVEELDQMNKYENKDKSK